MDGLPEPVAVEPLFAAVVPVVPLPLWLAEELPVVAGDDCGKLAPIVGVELPLLDEDEPVVDELEEEFEDWLPVEELDEELELELLLGLEDELELLDCCDSGVLHAVMTDNSRAMNTGPVIFLFDIRLSRAIPQMYTPF